MVQDRRNKLPKKDNFDGTKRFENGDIGYHVVHMYPTNGNTDEYCL